MRHRTALGLIVLLASVPAGAQRAEAGLRFCNQGNFKFSVAVGYVDKEKGWVGRGWQSIEGGECKDAIKAALSNRYYYFFAQGRAEDRSIVRYSGETPFCVQSTKFTLFQSEYGKNSEEECSKAGLKSEMFLKVDVQGKPNFTVNLRGPDTPEGANAAPARRPAQPPANQPPPDQPSSASAAPAPRPARPPAAQPTQPIPAPSVSPGGGTACQRYPNLC